MASGTLTVRVLGDASGFQKAMGEVQGKLGGFAKIAGAAALGAGVAGAAAFGKAFLDGVSIEAGQDKLAAQLGLTAEESERAGRLAGDLYQGAYGDSMAHVNTAFAGIQANIGDLGDFSDETLTGMGAKALDLSTIMEEDVGRVTRAVGQLMRNGLAPDAEAAFDIITAGVQDGANASADLLDTIEEYSPFFAELGFTGEQALGAVSAGLEAGARNGDLAADAFKEFSIRAIDGSKLTAEGFKTLGFDAEEMAAKIAGGGPAAAQATSEIIQALAGITDPIAREAAGVALFGTQFEDLGPDVIAAMDPLKASLGDVGGAAAAMGDTLNNNVATAFEEFKRTAWGAIVEGIQPFVEYITENMPQIRETISTVVATVSEWFTGTLVPAVQSAYETFQTVRSWWDENGPAIVAAVQGFVDGAATAFEQVLEVVGRVRDFFQQVFGGGGTVQAETESTRAFLATTWEAIGGIVGTAVELIREIVTRVMTGLQEFWDTWGSTILATAQRVWDLIKVVIDSVLKVIQGVINTVLGVITGDWSRAWEGIKGIAGGVWDAIKAIVETAIGVARDVLATVLGQIAAKWTQVWDATKAKVSEVWEGIKAAVSTAINSARDTISDVLGDIAAKWSEAWDGIKRRLDEAWADLKAGVSAGIDKVLTYMSELPGRIIGALGDLSGTLKSAGGDLLAGLASGIRGAIGDVVDAAVRAAERVVSGVKRALGISSPSKVFAEFGKMSGLGWAQGIKDVADTMQRATLDALPTPSGAALPAALPTYAPSGTAHRPPGAPAAAADPGRTQHIHIHMDSREIAGFMLDRSGLRQVRRIARVS